MRVNKEGLTYQEWLDAACVKSSPKAYKAWEAGVDPAEYRKD